MTQLRGSGLVDHSQKMTVAASATAEKKAVGAAIVAGFDASPVFEAAEHDLDAATAPVTVLVVSDRLIA